MALAATACGGSEGSDGGGSAGSGGSAGMAGTPGEWMTLVEGDWKLQGGTETYQCVRKTLTEDLLLDAFAPVDPLGTHHTVLSAGPPSREDGISPCGPGTNAGRSLFGAGVGTNMLELPSGVAVRVPAGEQLVLNLHLYNVSTDELAGTSGVRVRTVRPEAVENEAQVVLMGPVAIALPPNEERTIEGACTQADDVTVFAVQPHMHQIGTHMKVVAESSIAGDVVLHDAPYDFDAQEVKLVDPVALAKGDAIRVACTWMNPTTDLVTFGDSTDQEMCFAVVYRYPVLSADRLACFD